MNEFNHTVYYAMQRLFFYISMFLQLDCFANFCFATYEVYKGINVVYLFVCMFYYYVSDTWSFSDGRVNFTTGLFLLFNR